MQNLLPVEIRYVASAAAIALWFLAFYPYIRDTLKGKAKPHAFSWLIWGVLTVSAFAIQWAGNGWFGSFVTAFAALMCFTMSALGFLYGDRKYHLADFASLFSAAFALGLWWYNKDPFYSVIIMSLINTIWFVPTVRKTYLDPYSESVPAWNLMIVRGILGILALDILSFDTSFYIGVNLANNMFFVAMVLWCRKAMEKRDLALE